MSDVLADAAIAPGGPAHEAAALIEQRHAEPVDLGLAHELEARPGQAAAQARLELAEVVHAHGVVEREHGAAVLHGSEGLAAARAHRAGGAVGGDELGMRLLEGDELALQRVVLGVRDLRAVLGVIEVVVTPYLTAKRLDTGGGVLLSSHG